jgi:hypothetical protein
MKVFREMITPEIKTAVSQRLMRGGSHATETLPEKDEKIALLLVLKCNPYETLSAREAALVYGLTEPTLRKRDVKAGAMPMQLNMGK